MKNFKFNPKLALGIAVVVFAGLILWTVYPGYVTKNQIENFEGDFATKYDRAIAMNAKGLYFGATQLLKEAYAEAPNLTVGSAWFRNLRAQKLYSKAIETGKQILEDNPSAHDLRTEVAQLMFDRGDKKGAIALLQEGIDQFNLDAFKELVQRFERI